MIIQHPRSKSLIQKMALNLSNVARFLAFFTLANNELNAVAFFKTAIPAARNRRVMDKHVLFHAIDLDEAEALGAVEPFYNTGNRILRHNVLLFFLLLQAARAVCIDGIILTNKRHLYNIYAKPL